MSDAVGLFPLFVGQAVDDHAHGQAEEIVDRAHPLRVAAGEIIVDGDHVDALAGERIQIDRKRGDQRFSFTGLHFRDPALVQDDAADELSVEVAHAERALRCFPDNGKSLGQEIVERFVALEPLLELVGLGPQLRVGQAGRCRSSQRIDIVDQHLKALHSRSFAVPNTFLQYRSDHALLFSRYMRISG